MKISILVILLFGVYTHFATLSAQQLPNDMDPESRKYFELGIRQFEAGEYEMADASFKSVLETIKILPAEICYYFGANSYHLRKYKQSINWLNKYIELKGTSGRYFEESRDYLEKAQDAYVENTTGRQQANEASRQADDYSELPEIDCGPSGMVVCPVCKGVTVIIKGTAFGKKTYSTCPYCDEHGKLTCEEYNLLLKGQLSPKEGRIVE
jgi:tetratricopeptide (TPR) repeat protein